MGSAKKVTDVIDDESNIDQQEEVDDQEDDQEDSDLDDDEDDQEEDSVDLNIKKGSNVNLKNSQKVGPQPHPQANAWSTKTLLVSADKPPIAQLLTCKQEISALATTIENEDDLVNAREKVQKDISTYTYLYHWCFYYTMSDLDSKLQSDGLGTLREEKIKSFQSTMKTLWILALGLDMAKSSKTYFSYLQTRYVELNSKYFAHHVIPVNKSPHLKKGTKNRKPAGKFME